MDVDDEAGQEDLHEGAEMGDEAVQPVADDGPENDADDPARSVPLTRYNAMLAVVKNTLFMSVLAITFFPLV